MDVEKYRRLFLEEATEHLAQMSAALLSLEKEPADREAIDVCFRMAHSIKGMAASLDYAGVTQVAHRLEDCMDGFRAAGRVDPVAGLPLLFRGLEGLEAMVEVVRRTGAGPPADPELVAALSPASTPTGRGPDPGSKKKPPLRA